MDLGRTLLVGLFNFSGVRLVRTDITTQVELVLVAIFEILGLDTIQPALVRS